MIKSLFVLIIRFYQIFISPFLGAKCRFYPSCSEYSKESFIKFNFFPALWYSFQRILKCHPFNSGGYDPVPESSMCSHLGKIKKCVKVDRRI